MDVDPERVVRYIGQYERQHQYAPSIREIAEHVGLDSPASAQQILRKLRSQGRVDWLDGQPRTIHVVVSRVSIQMHERPPERPHVRFVGVGLA